MAGKPHSKAARLALEKVADDAGMTPLAYVCARIAGGDYLAVIARELRINRGLLSTYVNSLPGAKDALRVARAEGAHAMYEDARDVWDDRLLSTKESIAIAKGKSDTLLWGAQRLGRSEFGEDKTQLNVQVNVGSLSLDAMRVRSMENVVTLRATHVAALPAGDSSIADDIVDDAIILSDDDTTT